MSSTDVLLNIATAAQFFHTSDGTGLADLIIDGHWETWPLRSKRFGAWLRQQYERNQGCVVFVEWCGGVYVHEW